ncbi:MAG TPA: trigger factor family protein, partial [Chloroflexota bacterium]|nr:trigger factor family protein [Chloroflexota bacterium]
MKVTHERLQGSRVALTVEVEPEQVSRAADRAYQHLGGQFVVPGFRKGKAPRHILRNFVGEQRIRQETLDHLLPDAYRDALKDSGVEPIADPEVELLT